MAERRRKITFKSYFSPFSSQFEPYIRHAICHTFCMTDVFTHAWPKSWHLTWPTSWRMYRQAHVLCHVGCTHPSCPNDWKRPLHFKAHAGSVGHTCNFPIIWVRLSRVILDHIFYLGKLFERSFLHHFELLIYPDSFVTKFCSWNKPTKYVRKPAILIIVRITGFFVFFVIVFGFVSPAYLFSFFLHHGYDRQR